MTENQRTQEFLSRLRELATVMRHSKLAQYLKVPRHRLRNWLYRDTPADNRMHKLKRRLYRKYREYQEAGEIPNNNSKCHLPKPRKSSAKSRSHSKR